MDKEEVKDGDEDESSQNYSEEFEEDDTNKNKVSINVKPLSSLSKNSKSELVKTTNQGSIRRFHTNKMKLMEKELLISS